MTAEQVGYSCPGGGEGHPKEMEQSEKAEVDQAQPDLEERGARLPDCCSSEMAGGDLPDPG